MATDFPLVSVIIPTYNRAQMIRESIQSVLEQTYTNIEIIVVDDGSTDNTQEVVESFAATNIKYLYQENKRQAAARNHGIREAKGKYVAFLDSDDIFLPEKIEKQVRHLEANPNVGLLYSGFIRIGTEDNEERTVEAGLSGQPLAAIMLRLEIATAAVMMPRHIFNIVGYFDEELLGVEDLEFWVRVTRQVEIDSITEPLVILRMNSFNPNRFIKRRFINAKASINKIFVDDLEITKQEKRSIFNLPYSIAVRELYSIFPNIPKDISRWLIFSICLHILLHEFDDRAARGSAWRVLFRALIPRPIYYGIRPIWWWILGLKTDWNTK